MNLSNVKIGDFLRKQLIKLDNRAKTFIFQHSPDLHLSRKRYIGVILGFSKPLSV